MNVAAEEPRANAGVGGPMAAGAHQTTAENILETAETRVSIGKYRGSTFGEVLMD